MIYMYHYRDYHDLDKHNKLTRPVLTHGCTRCKKIMAKPSN